LTKLLIDYGLVLLFLVVAGESSGIPLPGETALIAAAILATPGQHHYNIVEVIAVAAAGAIVGDNVGYWLGRVGGRRLLARWRITARWAARALPPGERFFERHGGKTVFLARFIAFLRVTAAWLAGITQMPWWRFFLWNAAGGICWAIAIGLIAYYAGKAVADAIGRYGLYAAGGAIVLGLAGLLVMHLVHRRMEQGIGRRG
jgi:membrane protein DedA with SNARE-associated domain